MNLQQIVAMSSSLPILEFALNSLFCFLSDQTSYEHHENDESLSKDSGNDAEVASNTVAQLHFRQPQHIRGASLAS